MIYEPKILQNKTGKTIEFFYDGLPVIFKPNERRAVEGIVAEHALKTVNTGLTEIAMDIAIVKEEAPVVDDGTAQVVPQEEEDFYTLPWQKLRNHASKKGVFKTGMTRDQILRALEDNG